MNESVLSATKAFEIVEISDRGKADIQVQTPLLRILQTQCSPVLKCNKLLSKFTYQEAIRSTNVSSSSFQQAMQTGEEDNEDSNIYFHHMGMATHLPTRVRPNWDHHGKLQGE
jgi:hypothetical protein